MPLATRPVDSVRGMLDLDAQQTHAQAQLRHSLLGAFQLAGYSPIEAPLVEQADLYLRKSGAETISKMYTFEDFSGRRLALRPEFTASIVRYYLSNDQNAPFPLRYAYAGPAFRYEKPQRGRYRQFSMAGVELFGSDGPAADAEVIALACWTLKRLGVQRYRLVIGHVGILLELLGSLGLSTRLRHFLLDSMEDVGRPGRGLDYVRRRLEEIHPARQPVAPVRASTGSARTGESAQTEGSALTGGAEQTEGSARTGESEQTEGSARTGEAAQAEGSVRTGGAAQAEGSARTGKAEQAEGAAQTGESAQSEGLALTAGAEAQPGSGVQAGDEESALTATEENKLSTYGAEALSGSEAQAHATLQASLREMGIELDGSRPAAAILGRMFDKQRASAEDERLERAFAFIQGLHRLTGAPGQVLERARAFLAEYGLGDRLLGRLEDVIGALAAHGIEDSHVEVQLALGRGLHYYTDVVFELYDESGQSQLCGGGRYNELVQSLGGRKSIPAVGFAFGLERLRLALERQGTPLPAPPRTRVLVAAAAPNAAYAAMRAAQRLREHGIQTEYDPRQRAPRARVGYANRRQIPYLLLVEDDAARPTLCDLAEGSERTLPLSDVAQVLDG